MVIARTLAAVLLLSMTGVTPIAAAERERSEAGRALAERHCARCHAVGESGESPHKDAPAFRKFATMWPLENLEEALAEGIVTGHPDMPAFVFEPDEIDALMEHLHDLAFKERERKSEK